MANSTTRSIELKSSFSSATEQENGGISTISETELPKTYAVKKSRKKSSEV